MPNFHWQIFNALIFAKNCTFIGYKKKLLKLENSNIIYQKLEDFIRKFYTNELLRGTIFFVGIGLLYFILSIRDLPLF